MSKIDFPRIRAAGRRPRASGRWLLFLSAAFFLGFCVGCQSVQEKNMALISDRAQKLKPLSYWRPTWCRIEAHLTEPAMARYREMFPAEENNVRETMVYTWKARKTTCEITSFDSSPLINNHKAFLETAFCMLLQTHWVNSPFDELPIKPDDVDKVNDHVHIKTSSEPGLGVYLDPKELKIETRTKSHGTIRADYGSLDNEWLPQRIEQQLPKQDLVLDMFEYDPKPLNGRPTLKSFWISVGEDKPFQHTHVELQNCQNY